MANRIRNRVDATQRDIVIALRQVGCQVLHLHMVGKGCPDILVCFRGDLFLLEIKTPSGRLTDAEIRFGHLWPVRIVRSVPDAYRAIGLGSVAAALPQS